MKHVVTNSADDLSSQPDERSDGPTFDKRTGFLSLKELNEWNAAMDRRIPRRPPRTCLNNLVV
jgi:hypothetical protein